MPVFRGKLLVGLWLLLGSTISGQLPAQPVPGLAAVRVASGLTAPLFVTAPPGDYNRIFIVQQTGQVRILNLATGTLNSTAFLDIHASIVAGGEQGLLGLAFDPDYATNGKFYVNFTAPGGAYNHGVTHIAQFTVSADPDVADPTSVKTLLTFDQPQTNHNGGWIGFSARSGDDHNLYIATGDGGNANDADGGVGHHEPGGNAQWNQTLLGKMLRIHVDPATGTYTIPSGNPFANAAPPVKQEIWLLGLRNPFRDSFDRLTNRMFIGDVGQDTREEVDVQQASNPDGGENYGWRDREGFVQNPAYATATPTPTPSPPRVDPIFDYPHPAPPSGLAGQTVIGGYVYRGKQIPALTGTYVFADYLGPEGPGNPNDLGRIYTLNFDGTTASNPQDITTELFPTSTGDYNLVNPTSLGEDANGELYICDISAGSVYKIVPTTPNVTLGTIVRNSQTGHTVLNGGGVPFKMHTVQATSDLTQPFVTIGTATAAGDGTFQFDDATNLSARFYQVVYP
jgi:glucose/arabinose dehydrogenase